MKRNWIVLVLSVVALASCTVEKRVYQPGYHLEWNHFASQDAERDASQDLSENLETDVEQDVSQGRSEGASQDLPQDLSENLTKNLETDVSQGRFEGAPQDFMKGISRKEKVEQILQTVAPVEINSAKAESQVGQRINSDLALLLFILLAVFLPALTIFLLEGLSKRFWIALLFMICAFSLPFLAIVVRAILELIAIIIALAVVFNEA